jgi:hypothetical protein
MEWHHSQSLQKKKFKKSPYDAKREENSDASIKMLTELNKHFQ